MFHVDDPILAASHQQTYLVWNRIGEHMLLEEHEVMTVDRPTKHLSRQYLKLHTQQRWGFKVRLLQEYFDSIATAMEMVGCGSRGVPGRKKSGPTVGQVGQDRRTLGANDHSKYRVGKLQFMINEVPQMAYAAKNLSRQLVGPSELDMQNLKQCVRCTLGHSDEWLFLTRSRCNRRHQCSRGSMDSPLG